MNFLSRRVVYPAMQQVACTTADEEFVLGPDDVLLHTEFSVISAGTELAKLTGLQKVEYPFVPGNRAVGRVAAVGAAVTAVQVGARIFSHR